MLRNENFKVSNCWLMQICYQHGISFDEIHGELKLAPISDANKWSQEKMKEIFKIHAS